jgi:hypothetical protein
VWFKEEGETFENVRTPIENGPDPLGIGPAGVAPVAVSKLVRFENRIVVALATAEYRAEKATRRTSVLAWNRFSTFRIVRLASTVWGD